MRSQLLINPIKHIPQLDGWRGIAIIMVICYHYFPNCLICNFGWSGVDLFFVLSGFLISSRLLPYLDDKKLLSKFYRNRLLRIAPLYFAFLLVFFLAWFLLASKATLASYPFYTYHWWHFFFFIQNWTFIFNFPPGGIHLNHLWSLAVEEQFYLIFPLFILLVKDRRRLMAAGIFLIILIVVCRCLYFYFFIVNNEYERIYWNTFFRMDSLLTGFVLFLLYERKTIAFTVIKGLKYFVWIVILILISGIIINGTPNKHAAFFTTIGYTVIAIVYAYFLYVGIQNKNKILNRITLNSFLRYTGKISYGMYIFHWPVLQLGFTALRIIFVKMHFIPEGNIFHLVTAVCCIAITFGISHISFRYYESYFLKWKAQPGN